MLVKKKKGSWEFELQPAVLQVPTAGLPGDHWLKDGYTNTARVCCNRAARTSPGGSTARPEVGVPEVSAF